MRETLSKKGPFTVFAPSNEAIAKLIAEMGTSAEELLKDTEMLKKVVNHHVIKGSLVLSSDLIDGQEVEMLSGYSVTVSINDYGVMIDNATVVMLDLMAGNGVAHVIDTVLMPPLPVPVEAKAPALRVFNDKKKGMTCTAKPLEVTSTFLDFRKWTCNCLVCGIAYFGLAGRKPRRATKRNARQHARRIPFAWPSPLPWKPSATSSKTAIKRRPRLEPSPVS